MNSDTTNITMLFMLSGNPKLEMRIRKVSDASFSGIIFRDLSYQTTQKIWVSAKPVQNELYTAITSNVPDSQDGSSARLSHKEAKKFCKGLNRVMSLQLPTSFQFSVFPTHQLAFKDKTSEASASKKQTSNDGKDTYLVVLTRDTKLYIQNIRTMQKYLGVRLKFYNFLEMDLKSYSTNSSFVS